MATTPTQDAVPSESPRDLKFNAGKIDEFVTSLALKYADRFGGEHYTIEGLRWLAQQSIAAFGWVPIGTFQKGATLTLPNQILKDEDEGEYYRWDGPLRKEVPAGSTPESTGGIGAGAWLSVGLGGDAGIVIVNDLSEVTGKFLKLGSIVISNKNGGKYTVISSAPRNSRLPLIQCSNGYLIPLEVDDGSQFLSTVKAQTLTGYKESGSLLPQGMEYDNQNNSVFITSYRVSGADQLSVVSEYAINNDGTIGSLIASCENLPFGHADYVMIENASDGKRYLWGHSNPNYNANKIIRLEWTGATTGSNTPLANVDVTGHGAEKPFISWYGYEDKMFITFPSTHTGYVCNLDDLIEGNLIPLKTINVAANRDILYPRINQMIKHHGSHFMSISGYFMDQPLGTRTATTYETNAMAGSISESGGGGFNLDLVDNSVQSLNEIESMGFVWDKDGEQYKTLVISSGGDNNVYLYKLSDINSPVDESLVYKPWNTVYNDGSLSVWGANRALLKTKYSVTAPTLAVGGYNAGNNGSIVNSYDESNWVMSQLQGNSSRQECGEYFYKSLRKSVYGPLDTVRPMQWSLWDDRSTTGPMGSTMFGVSPNGVQVGIAFSESQAATESLKYALYVDPKTTVGGLKVGSNSVSGKPSVTLTGNRRLGTNDGASLIVGSHAESTNTWTDYVTFTNTEAAFNGPIRPTTDNSRSNGYPAFRWSVVYAGTATINTSDERHKTDIDAIPDVILDAWERVSYQQFRFIDAVDNKGNDARIHFGVIAQRVKDEFEAAGVDPFSYGVLCYDEWDDEFKITEEIKEWKGRILDEENNVIKEGEEVIVSPKKTEVIKKAGNIYGIRYEEALVLEAALMRRTTNRLSERISALEK